MLDDLVGTVCAVYVDDIVRWGVTKLELANRSVLILDRLKRHRMHASAEKSVFFTTEIKWCRKLYSAEGVRHDPARIEGFLNVRRPETGLELQHFLAATNWLHLHLPMLAEVVSPLRELLESLLRGVTRRTKRAASSKAISKTKWENKYENAWSQIKKLLQECVTLAQPRENCSIMVFTDASDLHWVGMITQVPNDDCLLIIGILQNVP